jgi:glycosyltransferase involved in cell wall biosynthesis
MKAFYGQIDLLLVPSLVEEAFPRMILEAAVNGVPVIANRRGGIPEALGDSGILIDWDHDKEPNTAEIAEKYVDAIRRVLDDDDLYRHYSKKALARAEAYELEQRQLAHHIYDTYIR